MSAYNALPGSIQFTTSQQIGSGTIAVPKAVRIFNIHLISGGTGSVLTVRNGIDVSGTVYLVLTGVPNTGQTFNFAGGIRLSGGCYMSVDGNITSAVVTFTEEI